MAATTTQSPASLLRADAVLGLLEKHGQGDYIGETISQLEHSLQAAHQAQKAGTESRKIISGCYYCQLTEY